MLPQMHTGSYFGSSKHFHDSGGLTVCESCYPSDFSIPPHEHENPFFCFVLEGLGTRSWPGHGGAERPMALTLFPSGHAHANYWSKDGGKVLHVEFGKRWLDQLHGRTKILQRPSDFDKGPPTWIARRMAAECSEPDSVSSLMIDGLALELLAECSRSEIRAPRGRRAKWLDTVRDLLRDRFAQTLSLEEIAAEVGVSADYLTRVFRKHVGCSVGAYVRRLRIEYVCERLVATDIPLADLAIAAGFTDQSHLTKVFKRQVGMTPAAYRFNYGGGRFHTKKSRSLTR